MSRRLLRLLWLGTCLGARWSEPVPPWRSEARVAEGVVRVLPTVRAGRPLRLDTETWVDRPLEPAQHRRRVLRTEELAQLPAALGRALPAALYAALGPAWEGRFHPGRWAPGPRRAVRGLVERGLAPDPALPRVAVSAKGDAVLVTWVRDVTARPLTAAGAAGDLLHTPAGPVVVDPFLEPYVVEGAMGAALVMGDKEILVRYEDRFALVLQGREGVARAAAQGSEALARELALLWASRAELERATTAP